MAGVKTETYLRIYNLSLSELPMKMQREGNPLLLWPNLIFFNNMAFVRTSNFVAGNVPEVFCYLRDILL